MTISTTYGNELKELERVKATLALSGLTGKSTFRERNLLLGGGLLLNKTYEREGRRSILTYNPKWRMPLKPARRYRYVMWPEQYNTHPWTLGWLWRHNVINEYEEDKPNNSPYDPWWHSINSNNPIVFRIESDWGYAKYITSKLIVSDRYYDVVICCMLLEAKGGIGPEAKGIWWDAEEQAWRGRAPASLKRWMRLGGLHLLPPPSEG